MSLHSKLAFLRHEEALTADPDNLPELVDPEKQRIHFSGMSMHGWLSLDVPYISCITDDSFGSVGRRIWQGGVEDGLVLPGHFQHVVRLHSQSYIIKHRVQTNLQVRMQDSVEQALDIVETLADYVVSLFKSPGEGDILIHCQVGLNRSGVVMGRVLQKLGWEAGDILRHLREVRDPEVLFNPAFEGWLISQ